MLQKSSYVIFTGNLFISKNRILKKNLFVFFECMKLKCEYFVAINEKFKIK